MRFLELEGAVGVRHALLLLVLCLVAKQPSVGTPGWVAKLLLSRRGVIRRYYSTIRGKPGTAEGEANDRAPAEEAGGDDHDHHIGNTDDDPHWQDNIGEKHAEGQPETQGQPATLDTKVATPQGQNRHLENRQRVHRRAGGVVEPQGCHDKHELPAAQPPAHVHEGFAIGGVEEPQPHRDDPDFVNG